MTPDPGTLRIISGWLNDLADLVRHAGAKPGKDRVAVYAVTLGRALPSGAFTADSLLHIASTTAWWPEFATLHPNLTAWWYDHRPPGAPLLLGEADQAEHLGVLDHAWLAYYRRRQGEGLSAERRANLDSLLRQQSPAAWKAVRPPAAPAAKVTPEQMAELREVRGARGAAGPRRAAAGAQARARPHARATESHARGGRRPPARGRGKERAMTPMQGTADLLAEGFHAYWATRCPTPALRALIGHVAQDCTMAGALAVLGYFLGDAARTEDQHTELLAGLAQEAGLHLLRQGCGA